MSNAERDNRIDVVNIDVDSRVYNLYEKREKIYTRKVEGVYQRLRLYTGWPLLIGYFLLPWLNIDGRQAVLFNLPERQFHIFWLTFWPQDFVLLGWVLIIAAFLLFFVTTWLGRVWCGYTCPQTVWTAIFMWIEQVTEGSRNQRMKLDTMPWSRDKIIKKALKHSMWIGVALITGATFVGYFYGIRDLLIDSLSIQVGLMAAFWVIFFSAATYVNAGWMREQVCIYMCPYARFQAAMFDSNTLIVAYDEKRGENRGPRRRREDYKAKGLGDCIDCKLCVHVCPTGIDIRQGMQYECIDCALCIDACDDVMVKMGYDKGLISYTTQAKQEGLESRFWRPKLVGYGLAAVVMTIAFAYVLFGRVPLQLDVIRDRGEMSQLRSDGFIQNNYTLKILNMDNNDHQIRLEVTGVSGIKVDVQQPIKVMAQEVLELPISVYADPALLPQMNNTIYFEITSDDEAKLQSSQESRFFGKLN